MIKLKLDLDQNNATKEETLIVNAYNNIGDFLLYDIDIGSNPKGYLLINTYHELEDWILNHKWNINNQE